MNRRLGPLRRPVEGEGMQAGPRLVRAALPPALAVVLHDVAPATWSHCELIRKRLSALSPKLPVTLLVVPHYHGEPPEPLFERWLDVVLAHGDELALHGYTHRDPGRPRDWFDHVLRRWYTAGEGEFAALGQAEARQRLRAGMAWFLQHGWPISGFVAPAWLLSDGGWRALEELGFRYTCTLTRLVALPSRASLRSASIVYSTRSAWRRSLSPIFNRARAWQARKQPLLRFEVHPADAEHPALLDAWLGQLQEALATRRPVTLGQAVRECLASD